LILEDLGRRIGFLAELSEIRKEIDGGSVPEVYFQSQENNSCDESKGIRAGFPSSTLGRTEITG
jgi:hypothetical protein